MAATAPDPGFAFAFLDAGLGDAAGSVSAPSGAPDPAFAFAFLDAGQGEDAAGSEPAPSSSLAALFAPSAPVLELPSSALRFPEQPQPLPSRERLLQSVRTTHAHLDVRPDCTSPRFARVFLRRAVRKGEVIAEEEPLLCVQTLNDLDGGAVVCAGCCAHMGGASEQLAAQLGRWNRVAALGASGASEPASLPPLDAVEPQQRGARAVACRLGCGAAYCGNACEARAWALGHALLCTGGLSEAHPLRLFERHARCTNETFLLGARTLAAALAALCPPLQLFRLPLLDVEGRCTAGGWADAVEAGSRARADAALLSELLAQTLDLPPAATPASNAGLRAGGVVDERELWWARRADALCPSGAEGAEGGGPCPLSSAARGQERGRVSGWSARWERAREHAHEQVAESFELLSSGIALVAAHAGALPAQWEQLLVGEGALRRHALALSRLEARLVPLDSDPPQLAAYCRKLYAARSAPARAQAVALLRPLLAYAEEEEHAEPGPGSQPDRKRARGLSPFSRSPAASVTDAAGALPSVPAAPVLSSGAATELGTEPGTEPGHAELALRTQVATERSAALISATAADAPTELLRCARTLGISPLASALCAHSCLPNAQLEATAGEEGEGAAGARRRGVRVRLIALRDLQAGDEVSLSLVPPKLGLEPRARALAQLLGAATSAGWRCACERCVHERAPDAAAADAGADGEQAVARLRRLAVCASEDGRVDDAVRLLRAWLRLRPADGDAHYALGAVQLGAGRWATARGVWAAGREAAPAHALLAAQAVRSDAYDCYADAPAADAVAGQARGADAFPDAAAGAPPALPVRWSALSGARPHGRVFRSAAPLLAACECAWLVRAVEAAAEELGGWTTGRHYAVPTTDMPVHALPAVAEVWRSVCAWRLFPLLAAQFGCDARQIRTHDAFVVRYAAGAQELLPLHTDEAQLSVTIALNASGEYAGGGTFFAHLGEAVGAEMGHVVSFDAHLLHGGDPITQGVRYIVAAFLYIAR
ncbi:hypothetical protein T492DRAFT_902259 [Pavlovales sp. CCMP2436]|nr:hypothetical protein T492DRAFT_902259 [Pavlovales sp. CCMP2436]